VVALSLGDGTFGVANDYAAGQPTALGLVELDGDGDLDLVTADPESMLLSVFHGSLDGSFELPETYPIPVEGGFGGYRSILASDLNEDGLDDVIVMGGQISVALSDGAGGLQDARGYNVDRFDCCSGAVAADFTDDGHLDLAMPTGGLFLIVPGDGEGRLLPAHSRNLSFLNSPQSLASGNLDGTPPTDLLLGSTFRHIEVPVLPSGHFNFSEVHDPGVSGEVTTADIDGDGIDDRIGCGSAGALWVYPSDPDLEPYTIELGSGCTGLVAADFDGDGNVDIAQSVSSLGVGLVFGAGDHTWSPVMALPDIEPESAWGLAVGDVDGDERMDLVVGGRYLPGSPGIVTVVRGGPGGIFEEPVTIEAELADVWMEQVTLADVNGDLQPDIVATSAESAAVAVAIGFGNGEFAEPQVFDLPEGSPTVAAGDLDGDGIADIVTVASDETTNINDARLVLRYSEGHVVL